MKMWDGRFSKPSDSLMERFNNSLPFDQTLVDEDIAGSIAWAGALERIGVFSGEECSTVTGALHSIARDYHAGTVAFTLQDEDIHMAVERLLVEQVGEIGKRLHTGRSRNDQVTTDFKLYVKKMMHALQREITALQQVLVDRAESDAGIIMPGYTHLQQAQPILLAHYWLSLFFLLEREKDRLVHAATTADSMPLGSGAVASHRSATTASTALPPGTTSSRHLPPARRSGSA